MNAMSAASLVTIAVAGRSASQVNQPTIRPLRSITDWTATIVIRGVGVEFQPLKTREACEHRDEARLDAAQRD